MGERYVNLKTVDWTSHGLRKPKDLSMSGASWIAKKWDTKYRIGVWMEQHGAMTVTSNIHGCLRPNRHTQFTDHELAFARIRRLDMIMLARFGRRPEETARQMSNGTRFKILMRDGFFCQYCGVAGEPDNPLNVDHVIPIARGGTDSEKNLVTACRRCNIGKMAKVGVVPPKR